MANFNQFWERRRTVYCLYYVCGEEACLREMVLTEIRRSVDANVLDYYSLDGSVKMRDLMTILQTECVTGKKLVMVRNAQRLKKFDRVVEWAKHIADNKETCLVIQTDETGVKTKEAKYRPFVELGLFVECKPLTEAKLYDFAAQFIQMDKSTFEALLEVTGWELSRFLNEVRRLEFLDKTITVEDINEYCLPAYDERFVDKLLADDKIRAARAVKMLKPEDSYRVVGLLEYRLSLILQIALLRRQATSMRDVVSRLKISFFVAKLHWEMSQSMSISMIRRRLSLLVSIDTHVRKGNEGALEVLLVQW